MSSSSSSQMIISGTSSSQLTMKLLVDNSPGQPRRVVFAEAGNDVVDFLFRSITGGSMEGCVRNLCRSVERLNPTGNRPQLTSSSSSSSHGHSYTNPSDNVYMITDDLNVTTMSFISGITHIAKFGVRDTGSLREKTVALGRSERRQILRAAVDSRTVLTDVFRGRL